MIFNIFTTATGCIVACPRTEPHTGMGSGFVVNGAQLGMRGVSLAEDLGGYAGTTPYFLDPPASQRLFLDIPGVESEGSDYYISTLDELKTLARYVWGQIDEARCRKFFEACAHVDDEFAAGVTTSTMHRYLVCNPKVLVELLHTFPLSKALQQLLDKIETSAHDDENTIDLKTEDIEAVVDAAFAIGCREYTVYGVILWSALNTICTKPLSKYQGKGMNDWLSSI